MTSSDWQTTLTNAIDAVNDGRYRSSAQIVSYLRRLVSGVDLDGKRVLEVGSGDGTLAIMMALAGAQVTALEPRLTDPNSEEALWQASIRKHLASPVSIDFRPETFQEATLDGIFDVIVLHNSINHLDESLCLRLLHDKNAQKSFVRLLLPIRHLISPAGRVLISDCGRRNMFGDMGIRNPFAPDIDWSLHQQPKTWSHLLKEAGFSSSWNWNSMSVLGALGRKLLTNWIGAYLTTSHFTLTARPI